MSTENSEEETVLLEENHGNARILKLNRPEKKNALSGELTAAIVTAIDKAFGVAAGPAAESRIVVTSAKVIPLRLFIETLARKLPRRELCRDERNRSHPN